MNEPAGRPGTGTGAEVALIAAGAAVIAVGAVTWAGARLAAATTGGHVGGGLGDWLTVTARLLGGQPPTEAWGDLAGGLPGPVVYWATTAVALTVAVAVGVGLWWGWRHLNPGGDRRMRFGQDTNATQARPRDVAPLIIDTIIPPTGRMLLGRMAPKGPLLATEDRDRHPLAGRAARRQGNRGSVALIGPTGSGKTALATTAVATWDGPAVVVSVKRDLYDTTIAARAARGDIAVFDPGGVTGLPTARWSPLAATTTSSGALRTGRALAQAIPTGGVTNADYWAEHGESLLGAFMSIAGLARLLHHNDGRPIHQVGMEQLATWVRTLALATEPTINDLLRRGLHKNQPLEVQLLARHAAVTLIGVAREDHKIRSSVYATAVLALKPWLEPAVAHSASDSAHHDYTATASWPRRPRPVDLDWLMAGPHTQANTLYLAAPSVEFERLSPVLGGLLADLKDTIHTWDIAGRHLDKPLLIVIDEAAHLQLGWLPTEVSTIAALGAFFVTCWQNLAQINHRYGPLADAVLSGHRTKAFFAGVDDPATTRYLTALLGSEHVTRHTTSHDTPTLLASGTGRRSVSESVQVEELAPAHTLRQMLPGHAVLLHATLPPIHLDALRWWNEPDLTNIINPTDQPHPDPVTCPLTDQTPPPDPDPDRTAVDDATLNTARDGLPPPRTPTRTEPHEPAPKPTRPEAQPAPADVCHLCDRTLQPGQGRHDRRNGHTTIRCAPSCTELKARL